MNIQYVQCPDPSHKRRPPSDPLLLGIVPDEIIDSLRGKKLHPAPPVRDAKDNALMLGEFPVVMKLIEELPEAKEAKQQVDRLIDAVGPPHGVEHIRETIVMDKMQFDVASDDYLPLLKARIMDQIEKYFMLIVFSLYCKEVLIILELILVQISGTNIRICIVSEIFGNITSHHTT